MQNPRDPDAAAFKNIVIFSDGTGNTAIKGRGTNVFKLFEALDLTGHKTDLSLTPQIAFYDDGVGTESLKPIKIFAGATGYGLGRNVRQLYKELVRVYAQGDQIYLFGFSRGAFTVRTLAGLIARCGVLKQGGYATARGLEDAVGKAYRLYRGLYTPVFWEPSSKTKREEARKKALEAIETFKNENSWCDSTRIRFIGVWDTVDAVGLPFHLADLINKYLYRFKFPDHDLCPEIEHACHALALDDERLTFHPLLWNEKEETRNRIEQVWFSGAHSNVGGGYPKQGMSLIALDWMIERATATEHGLRVHESDRVFYREHASVDDKLYDSRAGLGVFYRWRPRDVSFLCRSANVKPKVHMSVLERTARGTEDYAPGNVPFDAKVVFTHLDGTNTTLEKRAAFLEAELSGFSNETSLLSRVARYLDMGRWSYWLFACAWPLFAIALLLLVFGYSLWPWVAPIPLLCLIVAYVLEVATDKRLSAEFSLFWHESQQKLRSALAQAREDRSSEKGGAA